MDKGRSYSQGGRVATGRGWGRRYQANRGRDAEIERVRVVKLIKQLFALDERDDGS